ncbi:MAG: hypothetical protein ACI959_001894 [Limisphaerales bacterium]|jgi:hypothetical protein
MSTKVSHTNSISTSKSMQICHSLGKRAALLLILIGLLSFVGCKPGKIDWQPKLEQPEGLLSQEQMILFLRDAHLMEGAAIESNLSVLMQHGMLKREYAQLCRNHNVTIDQVRKSYGYYIEQPLTMNNIYKMVVQELTLVQSEFEQKAKAEPIIAEPSDSSSNTDSRREAKPVRR